MKVLFAASELYPLATTGGLGEVAHALPHALAALGEAPTLMLPAYRCVLDRLEGRDLAGACTLPGVGREHEARLWWGRAQGIDLPLLLLDIPVLYDRPGTPYGEDAEHEWWDNGERFAVFARAVVEVAMGRAAPHARFDLVHANDWQTGLVPAFLSLESARPRSVFTIHNLAYQGLFPSSLFSGLGLPPSWWSLDGLEFYGQMSMIKGGILWADRVTTVSPSYAEEICTPEFGCGLEGALQQCRAQGRLKGIVNGIDTERWNPATDPHLARRYSPARGWVSAKAANRAALLESLGCAPQEARREAPLAGFIGRLVAQKGVDLLLEALPGLLERTPLRFVALGAGEARFAQGFAALAAAHPQRVFVHLGYDEPLAHRIEAGCDVFVMPSRFEPCGLNQMYSMRYGTPPVVHAVGGLRDTVVDTTEATLAAGTATGFVFTEPTAAALTAALARALTHWEKPRTWRTIQRNGMEQDFGWPRRAAEYRELYHG
ncbi:glycogen synthase GlgA [Tepidiphilus olei]|uniref:glycogen synthase GlgA n=1 Tax=Tepidiphilus olei TaxID=2502184 RepID=UPI00115E8E52|nr:glycogen synthase GlgA [Tepidiphilus olei]